MLRKFGILILCVIVTSVIFTGCKEEKKKVDDGRELGGVPTTSSAEIEEETEDNSSRDTAVVIGKDAENKRMSLKSSATGSVYSVNYNNGTRVKSKYGNDMLMEKITCGMIVEVNYVSGTQKLLEIMESDDGWKNDMAVNWDVDYDKKIITIGSSSYGYDDNIFIDSNGKTMDIREISGMDELTVRGIGNQVLSVVVDRGHGFIRLKDEDNFVDGIVEVGSKIMTLIREDMIIAAPEGEYTLAVSKNGIGGEKSIIVERDTELIVSLADLEQPVERVSLVNFVIEPDHAKLYVDGTETKYDELVKMTYGEHNIVVSAADCEETYSEEIIISSAYTTLNISIADEEETDENHSDDEDESEDTDSEKETTSGREDETTADKEEETTEAEELDEGDEVITVNTPEGASVYFDGTYKGVAPVSFKKVAGEHVIILSKTGYETKMYTIDVVSDGEDMEINLPDMLASE